MKPGDLVGWKHWLESGIPSELGIIMEPIRVPRGSPARWLVAFGSRGVLQCRESDLQVIDEAR